MSASIDLKNVARFNGTNFQAWKFQMRAILIANDILEIVEGTERKPEDPVQKKTWIQRDAKAMFILSSSMETSQLDYLITSKSWAEMWQKLRSINEQQSESNKLILMTKFHEYKMVAGDSITQHIANVENMARQLKDLGETISDVTIMAKILGSLPSKFNALITAWDSVDAEKLTLQSLTTRLIKEENRMSACDESTSALAVANKDKLNTPHKLAQGNRQSVECFYCQKRGHIAKNCRKKERDLKHKKSKKSQKDEQTANVSAFIVVDSQSDQNSIWYSDSGASKHMTFCRDNFQNFIIEVSNEYVSLGDGAPCEIKSRGTINIKLNVNGTWYDGKLEDVLYVPSLNKNLFSVGACLKNGYTVVFERDIIKISLNSSLKAIGKRKDNNLFQMLIKVVSRNENCAAVTSDLQLWHERLGHVNCKTLHEMSKQGLLQLDKIPENVDFFCEACQYGKQHRLPFKKTILPRNMQPGELIHTDVGGPMSTQSIGGSRFYVNWIDDVSGFRHVQFLKHKSDVFERFKEFHAIIQNKFGRSIKILRMDNGKEYINSEMIRYLTKAGIQLETTAPYTPQQNGRSERDNRTLVESARSMLHAKNLPVKLWAEAINTGAYVLNRTPTTRTKGTTPYEIWMSKKPDLTHMKIFGSEVFAHVPKERRTKWDKKSKKLIFVGYQRESSNYRLYDPHTGKIIVSRDVNFNQSQNEEISLINHDVTLPLDNYSQHEDQEITEDLSMESERNCTSEKESAEEKMQPKNQNRDLRDRNKIKKPTRYEANLVESNEPESFEEAISRTDAGKWKQAIKEELNFHNKNRTWTLTFLPKGKSTIGCKWVFRFKQNSPVDDLRYKARLCAKGFTQKPGFDYKEIFSPVARYESVRTLLAIAAERDLEIEQFDVKTAFLYGDLTEEIYMDVPEGVVADKNQVCRLQRSLYGLKQASRQWNSKFDSFLKDFSFAQSSADPCVYKGNFKNCSVFLALYVDDGLLLAESKEVLDEVLGVLKNTFEITQGGPSSFAGIQIQRDRDKGIIFIHQRCYIERILSRFAMIDARPTRTPADPHSVASLTNACETDNADFPYREAIGSLIFLVQLTRPDLAYIVNFLSRYLSCPSEEHWRAIKRIFRYLNGTIDLGIRYQRSGNATTLTGYSDADYAGDTETRRSTTGYIFTISGGAVSWASQRQSMVSLSTTEAEYIAASTATKELVWLRRLLNDVDSQCDQPSVLYIDNQSAIKLIRNPEFHKRSKHIDIRYHFVREKLASNELIVKYVNTNEQCADFLTKALSGEKLNVLIRMIGLYKALE